MQVFKRSNRKCGRNLKQTACLKVSFNQVLASNEDKVDFSDDSVFSDQPNDTNLDPNQTNDLEHVPDVDDDASVMLPVLKEKSRYDGSQVTTSKQVKLIPSSNEDQVDFSEDFVFSDQPNDTNLDPDQINDSEHVSDVDDDVSVILPVLKEKSRYDESQVTTSKQVKLIPSSNEDQVDFSEDNVFSDQPNDTNLDPDQTNDLEHVPDVDDDVSVILPVLKEKSRYDESQVTTR